MTAGDIYTVAGNGTDGFSGDGGPATSAKLNDPAGVAVDGAGNLLIADTRQQPDPGGGGQHRHVLRPGDDRRGHLHRGRRRHRRVLRRRRPGHQRRARATRSGVAVDGAGNLVIADTGNNRVRVVAASTGTFYGQAMTAGDIYTVAGNGTAGFSGDGGPATSAELDGPAGVAVDAAGNLLIADTGNQRVRVVAAQHRHVLRAGDDRRGHLHRGRQRHRRVLRGRRPGHQRRARRARRAWRWTRAGNLVIADTRQRPGPGGGGEHRHVLRAGDDRRGHLHRGRQRHRRLLRRRRPGHQRRTRLPDGRGGGRARATW